MKTIYLKEIEIWNVRRFEYFKAELGQIITCRGENGSGKTTLKESIESFFLPGANANMIKQGCDSCKMRLTLSNGYVAEKEIRWIEKEGQRASEYELKVFNPEGGTIGAPATFLMNLLPRGSFDPQPFLDKFDLRERTAFVLDHLPVHFTSDEINETFKTPVGTLDLEPVVMLPPKQTIDLPKFHELQAEKISARAKISQTQRDMEGVIRTLESSLPQDDDIKWSERVDALQHDRAQIGKQISSIEANIDLDAERQRASKQKDISEKIDAQRDIIKEAEAVIQAANAQIVALNTEMTTASQKILSDARERKREDAKELLTQEQQINQDLAVAKSRATAQAQGEGVRLAIEKKQEEIKGQIVRYEQFTRILAAMDRLSASKMKAVKIPGFEIKFEKPKGSRQEIATILIHGLPLDELNRQQALFVAIKLIQLGQLDNDSEEQLRIFFLEGADLTETYEKELHEATREAGMSLVITDPIPGAELSVEVE